MKKLFFLAISTIYLFFISCSEKNDNIAVAKKSYENRMVESQYYYVVKINKGGYTANIQNFPKRKYDNNEFTNIIILDGRVKAGDIVEAYQFYQSNGNNRDITGEQKSDIVFGIKKVTERFPKDPKFDPPHKTKRSLWSKEMQEKADFLCEVSAPIVWAYGISEDDTFSSVLVYTDDLSNKSYHIVSTYVPSRDEKWEKMFVVSGKENMYKKLTKNSFQFYNYYIIENGKIEWKKKKTNIHHTGGF